jgi:hypothetical protein
MPDYEIEPQTAEEKIADKANDLRQQSVHNGFYATWSCYAAVRIGSIIFSAAMQDSLTNSTQVRLIVAAVEATLILCTLTFVNRAEDKFCEADRIEREVTPPSIEKER